MLGRASVLQAARLALANHQLWPPHTRSDIRARVAHLDHPQKRLIAMADADDHEKDVWKSSVDIPACRSLSSTARDWEVGAVIRDGRFSRRWRNSTSACRNSRTSSRTPAATSYAPRPRRTPSTRGARREPRAQDYEKAQRVLDKIDAHQHEKELKVQEKLKASERRVSIRSATSSSRRATSSPTCTCPPTL